MRKCRVLNVDILDVSEELLLEQLKFGVLVTPNVDHLVKLQKDSEFYEAYKEASYVICDSRVLALFSKLLPKSIVNVIPGSSFLSRYYLHHKENLAVSIFLLGAQDGVAMIARDNINRKVGREMVVGVYSPPFGFQNNEEENNKIIELVNSSKATVLVLGLGAPKQEVWINKNKSKLDHIQLSMCLGATIDFEANHIRRAPIFVQKLYLEWLYRFILEPKRMWKRYFVDDLQFFYYLFRQVFKRYTNPFK